MDPTRKRSDSGTEGTHRLGSIRYYDQRIKEWQIFSPRHQLFSTAVFLATEYWDGKEWKKINA